MQSVTTCRRSAGQPGRETELPQQCLAPSNCCCDLLITPVAEWIGLNIAPSQKRVLARNLMEVMERNGVDNATRLIEQLGGDAALVDEVIDEMTVGETYFFRDPAQFDLIRDKVLPSLLEDQPDRTSIRIWSAGCSTGEEAYSLAVLADELGLGDRAQVIATDISRKALETAREGRYGKRSLRGEAGERMRRYLSLRGSRLRLKEKFRRRVRFDEFCLGEEELPSLKKGIVNLDLIVCRNVLIYLRPEVVRRIARQFYRCLNAGGWLLLGPSDPPLWDHAPFATIVTRAGILYRRDPSAPGHVAFDRRGSVPSLQPDRVSASDRQFDPETPPADERLREARLVQEEELLANCIRGLLQKRAAEAAGALAAEAVRSHPLSTRLHHLQCVVLVVGGRLNEAVAALRKLLYLDGSLVAAHYLLGTCLRESDPETAKQAFAIAFELCARLSPEAPVELMEEYSAGQLAIRIGREIACLEQGCS